MFQAIPQQSDDFGKSGVINIIGQSFVLAGAKDESFPTSEERHGGNMTPSFEGSVADFAHIYDCSQLYNTVKVCDSCGKVCAYSIPMCNACGCSLSNVNVSITSNVFMGFIFGIESGPYPLHISIRYESECILVFDDPLAMTSVHFCAIPTDVYIPDIRHLFVYPTLGLDIVSKLSDAAWEATEKHFLDNESWFSKTMSPEARSLDRESVRSHVVAGFNYPPSQYQLHLQYMLPPITPFHYSMFRAGSHSSYGRFIPLLWVEAALTELIATGQSIHNAVDLESWEIFAKVKELTSVDYDLIHAADYERHGITHELFANYSTDDFEYALAEKDTSLPPLKLSTLLEKGVEEVVPNLTRKEVEDQDKLTLQSYGRPYDDHGRPSGRYYAHPKPSPLPSLSEYAKLHARL